MDSDPQPKGGPTPQTDHEVLRTDAGCGKFHLVITGPTGSGKSSLGNQLVGSEVFHEAVSFAAVTKNFKKVTVLANIGQFSVEDTTGTMDCDSIPCDKKVMKEVAKRCKRHVDGKRCQVAIVFCVKAEARYAEEHHSAYRELKRAWGDNEDFCRRLVVAFTHGDNESWQKEIQNSSTQQNQNSSAPQNQNSSVRPQNRDSTDPQDHTSTDLPEQTVTTHQFNSSEISITEHDQNITTKKDQSSTDRQVPSPSSTFNILGSTVTLEEELTVEERLLEKKLEKCGSGELMSVLGDAGGRYVLFKNKPGTSDERAVEKLINVVNGRMDLHASAKRCAFFKVLICLLCPFKSCTACWTAYSKIPPQSNIN